MSWFTKKTPRAFIAGMHLTRDEAQIFTQACQELEIFMTHQTEEIKAFPSIRKTDRARRAIDGIREQHRRIYKRLDDLVLRLRINHSKGPLRAELEEVARSMARKKSLWKDHTGRSDLDWKAASTRYWPRIADNYAVLLKILGSFRQDVRNSLRDHELWSDDATKRNHRTCLESLKSALKGSSLGGKPKPKGKHVAFEETCTMRVFGKSDAPEVVGEADPDAEWHAYGRGTEFVRKLARDGKRSTKEYNDRVVRSWTDAQLAAPHRRSTRNVEAGDGVKRQEVQKETRPVSGRPRVGSRADGTRARYLYDGYQETRMFVPL